MDDQLAAYLAEHTPTGDELFVIPGWVSANDFGRDQTNPAKSVAFIGQMLVDLGSAGAKSVLVTNTIDSPRLSHPELKTAVQRHAFFGGGRTATR